MKWFVALITAILIGGCTISIKPIPDLKKKTYVSGKKKGVVKKKHKSKHGQAMVHDDGSVCVGPEWLEEYRKLQKAHGGYTIPADKEIEVLPDGKVKINQAILKHYRDLNRASFSPTPAPSIAFPDEKYMPTPVPTPRAPTSTMTP